MAIDQASYHHDLEQTADHVWRRRNRRRLIVLALAIPMALVLWLFLTAPLSKSLQPQTVPSLTLLDSDGNPIARQGAIVEEPVVIAELPDHVWQAFLAIEDRRFYRHPGIDGRGLLRAVWRNMSSGTVREGGSTITQQLAKQSFLSSDRTAARKLQEIILALWLDARLSKDDILGRYLSTAYFGDNVYRLRAAANHYFGNPPEKLSITEAAMLAGLVKAPPLGFVSLTENLMMIAMAVWMALPWFGIPVGASH